ncbi:MAG: endonuclease/exonuclease/phosphatase family protein [Saprospiraceae bacterium]
MHIGFHTLAVICFIATLVSSLRIPVWWVKVWDVSRPHLTLVMSILFLIGLFYFPLVEWYYMAYLLLLLVSVFYHLYIIFPFTPFHSVELERTNNNDLTIRMLTCNVRQKNKSYKRLLNLVDEQSPDLLLLTEVDQSWIDAVISLKENYPHTVLQPQENTYGIALFSKHEFSHVEVKFLVKNDIPSIHARVAFRGETIQVLGLHPRPPAPWTKAEEKDIELIQVAGLTNHDNLPTIVGGDLNDVGWSKITKNFKQISGLLDPRIGRGFFSTYNALIPIFRVPIDHFFVSPHFKLRRIERLKKIGSDHFPVLIEVNLEEKGLKALPPLNT